MYYAKFRTIPIAGAQFSTRHSMCTLLLAPIHCSLVTYNWMVPEFLLIGELQNIKMLID